MNPTHLKYNKDLFAFWCVEAVRRSKSQLGMLGAVNFDEILTTQNSNLVDIDTKKNT
jgi:hypothetical protein